MIFSSSLQEGEETEFRAKGSKTQSYYAFVPKLLTVEVKIYNKILASLSGL
jgi:hypothetical protein